jgi:hypothetical protein
MRAGVSFAGTVDMMYAFLVAVHLLALAAGAAASFGNLYLMAASGPHDLPSPGFTNTLRRYWRVTALAAIALLWITGILMLVPAGGWVAGTAFAVKIALVAALTAIIAFVNLMAPGWARRGGPPSWTKYLHVLGSTLLVAIIVLAAVVFS